MTPIFEALFVIHDWASTFLAKHFLTIKKCILLVAHLSLFALLLPELRKSFGQLALALLVGVLFLSPLAKIFRMRLLLQLMGLRREFGIFMGYVVTVHGVGYLIDPLWTAVFVAPYVQGETFPVNPTYFLGIMAYFLTLPLLFTSNNLMQRWLNGRNWKRLHRLVYIVFPLVLLHQFSIRRGLNANAWLQTAIISGSYIFLKLLAWKNFLPPLEKSIASVATHYRDYTAKNKEGASHLE